MQKRLLMFISIQQQHCSESFKHLLIWSTASCILLCRLIFPEVEEVGRTLRHCAPVLSLGVSFSRCPEKITNSRILLQPLGEQHPF